MPVELKLPVVEGALPANGKSIQSSEAETDLVQFSWKTLGEGVRYEVTILNAKGKKILSQTVDEPQIEFSLKVARAYQWNVVGKLKAGSPGEAWDESKTLTLVGPAIETPEVKVEYSLENPIIKWTRPPFVSAFQLNVSLKTGDKEWKELIQESTYRKSDLKVPAIWAPGTYRAEIIATGAMRLTSKPLIYSFEIAAPEVKPDPKAQRNNTPVAAKKASNHHLEFGYAYAPTLKSISVASEGASASFNAFVGSSNVFNGSYNFFKGWQALGIGGGLQLTKKNLFESSNSEESETQKPQNIDTTDMHLLSNYRLMLGGFGIGVLLGYQNRALFLLTAEDLAAFEVVRVPLNEILIGGIMGLYFDSGSRSELSYLKATPTGKKQTLAYSRNIFSFSLAQPVISKNFLITGGYVLEKTALEYYVKSVLNTYASTWTSNQVNVGLSVAF